jgi:CpeT protein
MRTLISAFVTILLTASVAFAGRVDRDVVEVAQWLVGAFDTRAQAEADRAAGTAYKHDVALMMTRPIEDPVAFQDGLYLYVENRIEGQAQPYRQRVYRLSKSGKGIRLEVFKVDERVLVLLAATPGMLSQLTPSDLTREKGCDVLVERKGEGYEGATPTGSCKSTWKGSAYVTSSLRITKDVIVTLDRGYDAEGGQTFGPTDGRGYEFRRAAY